MRILSRLETSRAFVGAGGVVSAALTSWGFLASLMLDYRIHAELSLSIVFVMPLFCFLWGFLSWRVSIILLFANFGALAYLRAFTISPNPQRNPFDALGLAFLLPAICLLAAYHYAPQDHRLQFRSLWGLQTRAETR